MIFFNNKKTKIVPIIAVIFFVGFSFFFSAEKVLAATCTSSSAGNWNAITWTGCASGPLAADDVVINHDVTLNIDTPVLKSLTINATKTLDTDNGARTITINQTTNGSTAFANNGTFTAGDSSVIIRHAGTAITPIGFSGSFTGSNALNNLTIDSALLGGNRTFTISSSADLEINGDFTINPSASTNRSLTLSMGGSITVASGKTTTITRTTSATAVLTTTGSNYALTTGFLNIATGGTLTANAATITLTGTSGTLFTRVGTFTQGTSNVVVTSSSGTPTFNSATLTLHKLTINSTATVINMGAFALTINNVSGAALDIQAGVFNASGAAITGPGTGNGTLTIASGATLCLGGTTASTNSTCNSGATQTTARSMPTFQTYTFNADSTVIYLSDAATTVSSAPATYGNLILAPIITAGRAYTFGTGSLTINGDFTINPSAASALALTTTMGAGITVASGKTTTISRTSSATATLTTSGSNYSLSTGFLNIATGGTLTANAATITLTGTSGILFTRTGTFTQGTSNVVVTSSNGAPTLLSSNTTFHKLTINISTTVVNMGAFALTINNVSGAALDIQAGTFNASGASITGPGTGNGTLTIASGAQLCLGGTTNSSDDTCITGAADTTAREMPTFQTYSFDANSYVTYLSNAATTISSAPTYGYLSLYPLITANRTYTFGTGAVTINGILSIFPDAASSFALTVNMGNGITVASNRTTEIGGFGSATSVLSTTGSNHSLSTGRLTIDSAGTFTANASTVTLTRTGAIGASFIRTGAFNEGTSTFIFNPDASVTLTSGTITFFNLTLSPTITNNRTYTFGAGALTVNGDFTINPTAGSSLALTVNMGADITVASNKTTTIRGTTSGSSTLDSTTSNYNLTTGSMEILSDGGGGTFNARNSTLIVRGDWTNSGTFTQGNSTVRFIGSGAQSINNSTTFYNLVASTTAARAITFTAGTTQTIASGGSVIFEGASGQLLTLQSSVASSNWFFSIPAGSSRTVDYVAAIDANASDSSVFPTNSTCLRTTNWNCGGASPPIVSTNAASGTTNGASTLNGEITDNGGDDATQHGFAYGTDPTLATVFATSTLGGYSGTGTFNQSIGNLYSVTTYYFRAYATNPSGTSFGNILNFTTGALDSTPVRSMRLFEGATIKFIDGRMILYSI
jgi:fibronectin-binding autotransporter adhesin